MEINKQLFEEVLSGKLTGKFVLRNNDNIKSTLLERDFSSIYPYKFKFWCILYTNTGLADRLNSDNCNYDIVDFIQETNMKENKLVIEIPEGKEIDWKESEKQNKIVLKDKQLTYEDVCEKLFKNKDIFYIQTGGCIDSGKYFEIKSYICDKNNALTEHQLECILAKNQLANVAKYLNDGWKPSFGDIYVLTQTPAGISTFRVAMGGCTSDCGSIWFKSIELAQQAIEILGKETIKLALEPLGI